MKRILAVLIAVLMLFSLLPTGALAMEPKKTEVFSEKSTPTYSDIKGHWAEKSIERWSAEGVIMGSNGRFRPYEKIMRGDLAIILDRLMSYQDANSNTFTDLPESYYCLDAVLRLNRAGVYLGNDLGQSKSTDFITRQDAMVMIGRALGIEESSGVENMFSDGAYISAYARGYLSTMAKRKYIEGSNGKLNPRSPIARAEVVKILDNMIADYITEPGMYMETYAKDNKIVLVKGDGTTKFNGAKIEGDLVVAPSVGEGDVELVNTNVKGSVALFGCGENSFALDKASKVGGRVYAKKIAGTGLSVRSGTPLNAIVFDAPHYDKNIETPSEPTYSFNGDVDTIDIVGSNLNVIADRGNIVTADIIGDSSVLTIASWCRLDSANLLGDHDKLIVNGTVGDVAVKADDNDIEVKGIVGSIEIEGNDTTVSGLGTVDEVDVKSGTGTVVDTADTVVNVRAGAGSVTTGDGTVIKPGESGTTGQGGGGGEVVDPGPPVAGTDARIIDFAFAGVTPTSKTIATTPGGDGKYPIGITVPYTVDASDLTANITLATGATITDPVAPVTDFTSPVAYEITAEDGTTKRSYVVTVTVEAPPSEVPSFTASASVKKTTPTQKSVDFDLDTALTADGTWKVYSALTGSNEISTPTATLNGAKDKLTLSSTGADLSAGDYYVTITQPSKKESTPRQKLTVAAADAPTATATDIPSGSLGASDNKISAGGGNLVIAVSGTGFDNGAVAVSLATGTAAGVELVTTSLTASGGTGLVSGNITVSIPAHHNTATAPSYSVIIKLGSAQANAVTVYQEKASPATLTAVVSGAGSAAGNAASYDGTSDIAISLSGADFTTDVGLVTLTGTDGVTLKTNPTNITVSGDGTIAAQTILVNVPANTAFARTLGCTVVVDGVAAQTKTNIYQAQVPASISLGVLADTIGESAGNPAPAEVGTKVVLEMDSVSIPAGTQTLSLSDVNPTGITLVKPNYVFPANGVVTDAQIEILLPANPSTTAPREYTFKVWAAGVSSGTVTVHQKPAPATSLSLAAGTLGTAGNKVPFAGANAVEVALSATNLPYEENASVTISLGAAVSSDLLLLNSSGSSVSSLTTTVGANGTISETVKIGVTPNTTFNDKSLPLTLSIDNTFTTSAVTVYQEKHPTPVLSAQIIGKGESADNRADANTEGEETEITVRLSGENFVTPKDYPLVVTGGDGVKLKSVTEITVESDGSIAQRDVKLLLPVNANNATRELSFSLSVASISVPSSLTAYQAAKPAEGITLAINGTLGTPAEPVTDDDYTIELLLNAENLSFTDGTTVNISIPSEMEDNFEISNGEEVVVNGGEIEDHVVEVRVEEYHEIEESTIKQWSLALELKESTSGYDVKTNTVAIYQVAKMIKVQMLSGRGTAENPAAAAGGASNIVTVNVSADLGENLNGVTMDVWSNTAKSAVVVDSDTNSVTADANGRFNKNIKLILPENTDSASSKEYNVELVFGSSGGTSLNQGLYPKAVTVYQKPAPQTTAIVYTNPGSVTYSSNIFLTDYFEVKVGGETKPITPTFSVVSGGTGIATVGLENRLDVSKAGDIKIKADVSGTEDYTDATSTVTLKIDRASQSKPFSAPTQKGSATDDTIVLNFNGVDNEYACSLTSTAPASDEAWKVGTSADGAVFTGLNPDTTYYFFRRYKQTELYNASEASTGIAITTKKSVDIRPTEKTAFVGGDIDLTGLFEVSPVAALDDAVFSIVLGVSGSEEITGSTLSGAEVGSYEIKLEIPSSSDYYILPQTCTLTVIEAATPTILSTSPTNFTDDLDPLLYIDSGLNIEIVFNMDVTFSDGTTLDAVSDISAALGFQYDSSGTPTLTFVSYDAGTYTLILNLDNIDYDELYALDFSDLVQAGNPSNTLVYNSDYTYMIETIAD